MADSSDWEVLKLPLELEIANKNRQSGLPRAQENSAKDVSDVEAVNFPGEAPIRDQFDPPT